MVVDDAFSEVRITNSLAMNWENVGVIIGISGKYFGSIIRIKPNKRVYFGRDYDFVDFIFDAEQTKISRRHCWIEYDDEHNRYKLRDCSKNGVYVNGCKQIPQAVCFLSKGDELQIADTEERFKLG